MPVRAPLATWLMMLRDRTLIPILAGLIVPFTLLSAQPAGVNFIVQVSPLSNLIYHLDCLAGIAHCSRAAYSTLWHSKLGWSAEDQAQLEQWQQLREKYRGEIVLNEPKAELMPLPWNGPTGLQLDDKFSIATFHAHDRASLRSHWEVIVAPTDVPRLEAIIDHFEPRFTTWWVQVAEHDSEQFKHALQNTIARTSVVDVIRLFARFCTRSRFPRTTPSISISFSAPKAAIPTPMARRSRTTPPWSSCLVKTSIVVWVSSFTSSATFFTHRDRRPMSGAWRRPSRIRRILYP